MPYRVALREGLYPSIVLQCLRDATQSRQTALRAEARAWLAREELTRLLERFEQLSPAQRSMAGALHRAYASKCFIKMRGG